MRTCVGVEKLGTQPLMISSMMLDTLASMISVSLSMSARWVSEMRTVTGIISCYVIRGCLFG
jgi:hypothetical protein